MTEQQVDDQGIARPLAGVRVVETATYISGPYAGLALADLGAEVVKIEPPRGDPLRRFGQPKGVMSAFFANCNRGKQSVVLDVKTTQGRQALLDLVADADVFVSNWRSEAAARLGLDDELIASINPGIVRLWLTGFGRSGPWSSQPAFDATMQALSGMAYLQGDLMDPELVRSYLYDKTTGLLAAQAVLAALFGRSRTGVGTSIDLSMLASAAYFNFADMMADQTFLDIDSGTGANDIIAANNPVRAKDGWLVVSPVTVAQIRRACEAVGMEAETVSAILSHKVGADITRTLITEIGRLTPQRTVAEWLLVMRELDVPAAPCLRLEEHLAFDQMSAIGAYRIEDWPGIGAVRMAVPPASFSGLGNWQPGVAPALGADTEEVLGRLRARSATS